MTYTIAIANEKGGVAKTTTTMSLGAALAEAGQNIVFYVFYLANDLFKR